MVEAEPWERGEGADREVADDGLEVLVGEDAAGLSGFVGADRLAKQGGAGGVGKPFLEGGHAVERDAQRRSGYVDGGGQSQVAGGRTDGQGELAGLKYPAGGRGGPVGEIARVQAEAHCLALAGREAQLGECLELSGRPGDGRGGIAHVELDDLLAAA